MPIVGEGINTARALLLGEERPESYVARLAEDYAAPGAFGLYYNLVRAAEFDAGAVAGAIFGPTVADTVNVAANLRQAAGGKPKAVEKQILKNIPFVGQPAAKRVFP